MNLLNPSGNRLENKFRSIDWDFKGIRVKIMGDSNVGNQLMLNLWVALSHSKYKRSQLTYSLFVSYEHSWIGAYELKQENFVH